MTTARLVRPTRYGFADAHTKPQKLSSVQVKEQSSRHQNSITPSIAASLSFQRLSRTKTLEKSGDETVCLSSCSVRLLLVYTDDTDEERFAFPESTDKPSH